MKGPGASPAPLRIVRGSEVPARRQIALAVAGRIHDGTYDPGHRLPSVRALGDRLDVHRDTVLAAYRELVRTGLVRTVPGGGVFVRPRVPPLPELFEPGAEGLGLRLASLGAAMRWRRVLVLADEPELGEIVARELAALLGRDRIRTRHATSGPLPGLDFGWLPVRILAGAAADRVDRGAGPTPAGGATLRPIPLPLGPGERLLARLSSLRFPDVVGIVSASAVSRGLLRESVRAVGGPDVGVATAAPGDGRALRRVRARATLVLTDASVGRIARQPPGRTRRRHLPVRLVPAAFGAELLDLFGREGTSAGSGR